MRRALLLALFLSAGCAGWPTRMGPEAAWRADGTRRYLPMQLIVPGPWDGGAKLEWPAAKGSDSEGTTWSGPLPWTHPYSGKNMTVYARRRGGGSHENSVDQRMAPRDDGAALGRAYDSRFGGIVCAQEAKFPLGLWQENETRTFDYSCLTTRDGKPVELRRSTTLHIERLDYEHRGVPHSLRFTWTLRDRDTGEVLDDRAYVFSPGRGLVAHDRR